jgi:hypothetical protein
MLKITTFLFFLLISSITVKSGDYIEKTIKKSWIDSDLIFEGTVNQKINPNNLYGLGEKLMFNNIIVNKVFKGDYISVGDTISVIIQFSSAHFHFEINKSYLVFTNATRLISVLRCDGTIPIESTNYTKVIDSVVFYSSNITVEDKHVEYVPIYGKVEIVKKDVWENHLIVICLVLNVIFLLLLVNFKRRKSRW